MGNSIPPYSNFRYEVVKEKNANYSNQYQEVREVLAGFDGTYYIIRLDVSKLIEQVGAEDLAASYLHVKQEGNLALTAIMPKDQYVVENFDDSTFKKGSFADLLGNQTVSYSLADSCSSLKDSEGNDKENPYVDIILVSSGACVDNIYSEKYSDVAADFKLMMYIDKTADYDPSLTDYPAEYKEDSGANEKFLNKYFNDEIFNDAGTDITSSYLVKGSDLEIEVQALSPAWFWSLKKALTHTTTYNDGGTNVPAFTGDDAPIKLISEIRSRDKMTLEGAGRDSTIMIIDLNGISLSFENNDPAGEAGISVEKATLRIKDELAETVYSTNLGSKLSLGNNSSIRVGDRGRLCIKENTRLDVDYYTRSTTISENSAAQVAEPLESGAVTIEDGGEIINDGVITIKGKEEKVTGSSGAERVFVNAEFYICEGGKLTNNGCLLTSGKLYNMGTITNFGSYSDSDSDIIKADSSKDGDYYNYKGIQIVCKDDMTQTDMESMKGDFTNGMSPSGETNPEALIDNYGDILISPGRLDNYGYILNNDEKGLHDKNEMEATTFPERKACIYLIAVNQALCPDLDPYDPTVKKKYIYFGTPVQSYLSNETGSTLSNNGIISPAKIKHETCINDTSIYTNKERFATVYKRYLDQYGSDPNEWTDEDRLCYEASLISNSGAIENTGSGSLIANELQNTGYLLNGYDSGGIDADIILSKGSDNNCVLTDSANVLTRVYNGSCKKSNNVNEWTYVPCTSFEVTPIVQDLKLYNDSEKTERSLAEWTVTAHADETQDLTDVQFLIDISYSATVLDKTNDISHKTAAVQAETPTKISGLPAPKYEGRMICDLCVNDDATDMSKSTVINVTDSPEMFISTPIASELIYDGTEQPLFSQDEMDFLQLECSICTSDESAEEQVWSDWSREVFKKKDAGDYKVRFRKTDSPDCVSEAVTYTIDRRIAVIDINDFTVKTGTTDEVVSSKIQITTFGMVEGDTLNTDDLSFYLSRPSTSLPYSYIYIRGTVEEKLEETYSNYDFEILRGTVNYTENDYTMTASSKSREYSDDLSYNECYIEVNVPDSAKVYYSAVYQLDESNYNTCGREIPEYASHKAGRHMMYYYIYDESQRVGISASKNYYILKSPQKSISANTLNTKATGFVNSRDGLITGLTPRSNEYHRAGIPYGTAYCEEVEVYPGQYYVRSTGDANHYPGPVTVLTVEEGPYITANYISKEEKIKSETDLIYGSLLSPPELPEIDDHDYFLGWFSAGEPADFTRPVTKPIDFEAMWETRYTVTFDISLEDYPYTIPESQIVKAGNTVSKPDVPAVDGYRMTGWTCDGVSWDFSNPVNKDITLIAQYERIEPDTIQIDFDLNGLEGTVPARQFVKTGSLITEPEKPVVEDYEFICWTYENSPWNFTTPVYNDMTLVARFIYSKASASCNQGSGMDSKPILDQGDAANTYHLYMVKKQVYFPTTDGENDTWTVEDKKIATVAKKTGKISAKKKGCTKVTNGTTTYYVHVAEPALDTKKLQMVVGQTGTMGIVLNTDNEKYATKDYYPVTWVSSKPSVAVVNGGVISAMGKGSAKITAYVGGKAYKANVSVKDTYSAPKKITTSTVSVNMIPLQSFSLKFDSKTIFKTNKKVIWEAADGNTLTTLKNNSGKITGYENGYIRITPAGKVTALMPGTTTIMGTDEKSRNVTVTINIITTVSAKNAYMNVGKKKTTIKFQKVNNNKGVWTSSDGSVATVDNKGKVTALKTGVSTITCSYNALSTGENDEPNIITYSTNVFVEDPKMYIDGTSYENNAEVTIDTNTLKHLTLQNVYQTVSFKSNKSAVAFIDENGIIYAQKAGKAVISFKLNGKTYKLKVTVVDSKL